MKELSDLGLIAALTSLGFSSEGRRKEGQRVFFSFEDTPELEKICDDYFNHKLMVDAFNMHMCLKQVKTSIMQTSL